MGKYLHLFDSTSAFTEAYNGSAYTEPWVSYTEENEHVDYNKWVDPRLKEPFTIEITSPGHLVAFISAFNPSEGGVMGTHYTFEYKKNDDDWSSVTLYRTYSQVPPTWDFVDSGTSLDLTVTTGDVIRFRSDDNTYSQTSAGAGFNFGGGSDTAFPQKTTAGFIAKGNLMSLVSSTNFENLTSFGGGYTFPLFYGCSGLTDASGLILPATELTPFCYANMFTDCTNLTAAPELLAAFPRTYESYYEGMFNGCSSLNYIKCLATENIDGNTYYWTGGVSATGTFVKTANATWPTGGDGIPNGWTVVNA